METRFDLDGAIRRVPDFPKPGVLFYDITSVLTNPLAFAYCIDRMVERYEGTAIDGIIAVESRGFIFGAPVARKLAVPLILARKQGKLPGQTFSKSYELEYGTDTIEIHRADIHANDKLVIVDDLVATGGTLKATAELVSEVGASIIEVFCIIGLPFLGYLERLAPLRVHTLVDYQSEA